MVEELRFVVRTPHEVVLDRPVRAARVPTESGQVGLRPRAERLVTAVEPGLVVFWQGEKPSFVASAGGVFESDRERAELLTPFAVVGDRAGEVLAGLEAALATPESEIAARRRLGELEEQILSEVRHRPPRPRGRAAHD